MHRRTSDLISRTLEGLTGSVSISVASSIQRFGQNVCVFIFKYVFQLYSGGYVLIAFFVFFLYFQPNIAFIFFQLGAGIDNAGAVSPTALLVVRAGSATSSGGADDVAVASGPAISTVPAQTKEQVCLLLWSLDALSFQPSSYPSLQCALSIGLFSPR